MHKEQPMDQWDDRTEVTDMERVMLETDWPELFGPLPQHANDVDARIAQERRSV